MVCFSVLFLSLMLFPFFCPTIQTEMSRKCPFDLSQPKLMANSVFLDKTCRGLMPGDDSCPCHWGKQGRSGVCRGVCERIIREVKLQSSGKLDTLVLILRWRSEWVSSLKREDLFAGPPVVCMFLLTGILVGEIAWENASKSFLDYGFL